MVQLLKKPQITVVTKEGECEITITLDLNINLNMDSVPPTVQLTGKVATQNKDEEKEEVPFVIPEFGSEKIKIKFGERV